MNDLILPDADRMPGPAPEPGQAAELHGRHLAALALVYLRHAAAPRAMVLGLAAMTMGDLRPQTVLLVAQALVEAGDPDQALAVLTRFDDAGGLGASPSAAQEAARHYLAARAHHRQGRAAEARAALDRAIALAEGLVDASADEPAGEPAA